MRLWQNMVSGVDDLRLEVALKMLKSPHFNAKMNSLKEVCNALQTYFVFFFLFKLLCRVLKVAAKFHFVRCQNTLVVFHNNQYLFLCKHQVCKLIDDSEKSKNPKVNISQDVITEWLLQNKVLSIAFESKFTIHYFVG